MRRLRYFFALICTLASLGAIASDECLGDLLSKSEKEEIKQSVDRFECGREPTHIKRIDVNGDGVLDFVVSHRENTFVLIRKRGKLEMQYIHFGISPKNFCPSRSGSICLPEILQLPSVLQTGYDVIIRSWQGCALIRRSDTPWKYDKHPWYQEKFDCEKYGNRDYLLAQVECVATQGRWGALNWGNRGNCWHPAVDIGKPCRSSSDCEKLCVYEGPAVPHGSEVTGNCSEYMHCRTDVVNGKLGGHICVD